MNTYTCYVLFVDIIGKEKTEIYTFLHTIPVMRSEAVNDRPEVFNWEAYTFDIELHDVLAKDLEKLTIVTKNDDPHCVNDVIGVYINEKYAKDDEKYDEKYNIITIWIGDKEFINGRTNCKNQS